MTPDEIREFQCELVSKLPSALKNTDHRFVYAKPVHGKKPRSSSPFPSSGNLQGFGYGLKVVDGVPTSTKAIKIFVKSKLPKGWLAPSHVIPAEINGLPTDIVSSSKVRASANSRIAGPINPRALVRPALGGVSISHYMGTAGTLGCLVRHIQTSAIMLLSAGHVLSNTNAGARGDLIVQPGVGDGGSAEDAGKCLAELTDYEVIVPGQIANEIDAGVAVLLNSKDAIPDLLSEGRIAGGPVTPFEGMIVQKYGRTTDWREGTVLTTNWANYVYYDDNSYAWFENQFEITGSNQDFGSPGDSGALVVTRAQPLFPVGLLVGCSYASCIATPISSVLDRFSVEILG